MENQDSEELVGEKFNGTLEGAFLHRAELMFLWFYFYVC